MNQAMDELVDSLLAALAARDMEDAPEIKADCSFILGFDPLDCPSKLPEWAGRQLAWMGQGFAAGKLDLSDVQEPIARLAEVLKRPDWLVTLARNCEYAQGMPAYRAAFESEFRYLSRLWSHSPGLSEFLQAYDQRVSSKHNPV